MRFLAILGVLFLVLVTSCLPQNPAVPIRLSQPRNVPQPSLSNTPSLANLPNNVGTSEPPKKATLNSGQSPQNAQPVYQGYYQQTGYSGYNPNYYPSPAGGAYNPYYPNPPIVNPVSPGSHTHLPNYPPHVHVGNQVPPHPFPTGGQFGYPSPYGGQYYQHGGSPACFLCPQTRQNCTWKLAFKAVSGNNRLVYNDYTQAGSINANSPDAKIITSSLVFRDGDILDNWNTKIIQQVKVEMFASGERKVRILYDGIGSNNGNWFTKERLIASNYKDVKSDAALNFHSIVGDPQFGRRFFINRSYATCSTDCGYMVVIDPQTGITPCPWGQTIPKPVFRYGQQTDTCSIFQTQSALADRFLISVKECTEDW